jgi:branched-chain amino acid transport system permease protein
LERSALDNRRWAENKLLLGAITLVALVIALTLVLAGSKGLQWILSGLVVGSIYSLIAMGFSVIFSSTRVINFAQGEFSMLGGMFMFTFATKAHLSIWLSFILSVLVVAMIGAVFERTAILKLRGSSVITVIIVTIGFSIFLKAVAKWIWGTDPVKIAPFTGEKAITIFKAAIVPQSFWVFGLTFLSVAGLFFFFSRTRVGRGMRAAADNTDAASLVGVSASVTSLTAWTVAAALGAAAGIIIGPITPPSFSSGMMLGLKGFSAAVLGGLGNIQGAVVGGLMLGVLENIIAGVLPTGYKEAFAFLVLILVLLIRPQGLLGKPEEVKV